MREPGNSKYNSVEKVTKAFLSVPLYKRNNTHIKNLFRVVGHRLPSETTCRRTALQLSEDESKRIQNAVYDKQIFLIVDESTLSGTRYLNILVASLETPHTCVTVNLKNVLLIATLPLKQLTILLEILKSTEASSACYCLMPRNI